MKDILKLFGHYCLEHLECGILVGLFSLTFFLLSFLYHIPVEPALYATCLGFAAAVLCMIWDFRKQAAKHHILDALGRSGLITVDDLPEPSNLIETDYTRLLDYFIRLHEEDMAASQNSQKDLLDYFTMWAHQIKTPIAAMHLILQSEEDLPRGELTDELFKIEQYADMVLSYLRMGSDSTDYLIARYPLQDIVLQAVRKFVPQFIRKKIRLEVGDMDCTIVTDEKWLCFVIEQLLSNALKYTSKGSISIYLQEPKLLVIEDTGIGIAPEDLPRLGQKGFTGYNGRKDKKSTGIGLYLCRQILSRLSHTLTIESVQGKGTRALIDLDTVNLHPQD